MGPRIVSEPLLIPKLYIKCNKWQYKSATVSMIFHQQASSSQWASKPMQQAPPLVKAPPPEILLPVKEPPAPQAAKAVVDSENEVAAWYLTGYGSNLGQKISAHI